MRCGRAGRGRRGSWYGVGCSTFPDGAHLTRERPRDGERERDDEGSDRRLSPPFRSCATAHELLFESTKALRARIPGTAMGGAPRPRTQSQRMGSRVSTQRDARGPATWADRRNSFTMASRISSDAGFLTKRRARSTSLAVAIPAEATTIGSAARWCDSRSTLRNSGPVISGSRATAFALRLGWMRPYL